MLRLGVALLSIANSVALPSLERVLQQVVTNAKTRAEYRNSSPKGKVTAILTEAYTYSTQLLHYLGSQQRLSRTRIAPMLQSSVYDDSHSYYPANGTYYALFPEYITTVAPAGTDSWSSSCLMTNQLQVSAITNNSLSVILTTSNQNSSAPFCSDFYLLATVDHMELVDVSSSTTQTYTFPVSETTWTMNNGIRVFRFIHSSLQTIADVVNTLTLFVPSLTASPPDAGSQARNAEFLQDYVGITMEPRAPANASGLIDFDPSVIQSGDMLAILRMDGLATVEMWGTGAATSHITMGMRFGDTNDLYIVESTDKGADWPLPNIQMNRWEDWVPMAVKAGYMVVHLPLSNAIRSQFNVSLAQEFIFSTLGLPYGYHNFINTFFDTPNGNLPWPASWQIVEIVVSVLAKLDSNLTDSLVTDALNMRLGTTGLSFVDAVNAGTAKWGSTFGDMLAMPEQDTYVYSDGRSMVCDVYWCAIHKAAGSFGSLADSINCAEFHNLDAYRLNFFDFSTPRQPSCVAADPTLPYCQIMGNYRLNLPFVNSMAPYAHMNEHCSALPLDYTRQPSMNC